MIRFLLPACIFALLAVSPALADEKLRAELRGIIVLRGPAETVQRAINGKVTLSSRYGRIRKMEIYTEWSGPNEVRQKMHEFYLVRGTQFAGYVEREYTDPLGDRFSRTEVRGSLSQRVRGDTGEGQIKWTISEDETFADETEEDETNDDPTDVDNETDDDGDLIPDSIDPEIEEPVVTADEEGVMNLVLSRTLSFEPRGDDDDRPRVRMHDSADETLIVEQIVPPEGGDNTPGLGDGGGSLGGGAPEVPVETIEVEFVRSTDASLEGPGSGSLAFDEDRADRITEDAIDEAEAAANPTPTATPIPAATPDGF